MNIGVNELEMIRQMMLPVIATIILALLGRYTIVKQQLPYVVRQVVIGIIFGFIAIYCTENGAEINGAVMNVRDAAVVSAGLLFGGPAGIIAGAIGGYERWIAVAWGVGTYTRVACSVSTFVAGIYSAILRKYMFDNKKPSWGLALATGLVMEVFHMTMVFITNMSDTTHAAEVVKVCTIVMVPANSIGVMLSTLADGIITREKKTDTKVIPTIASTIQKWLLVSVVILFGLTTWFVYQLQTAIAERQAQDYLTLAIDDVVSDVVDASDRNLIDSCYQVSNLISKRSIKDVAQELDISEINVVNEKGIITDSTNDNYLDFDMASGEQSAEFLCLLEDTTEFAQEYGPTTYDHNLYKKYAGIKYKRGFIQIAYDANQFQTQIASEVKTVANNRHIGNTGFIVIADNNKWVVSEPQGVNISKLDNIGFTNNDMDNFFKAVIGEQECLCYCVNAEGYYVVSCMSMDEVYSLRDTALYANTFMEILVFALFFGMIYFLIKAVIVDKVNRINNSLSKITDGDLEEVVNVRTNSEFDSLSNDINSTVDTLKEYIKEASARIDAELEYAKNIQNSALPHIFPKDNHFEMYALMDAAKEVGGDFYDFSRLSRNTFNILVADVSGKGIPGAMFMMRAKSVLSSLTDTQAEVNDVFTDGNNSLCVGNDAGMFVTAWEGSINLDDGHVKYANAGHNPPVIKRSDGTVEFVKGKAGFVLAGMEDIQYKVQELDLKPGDIIFLYTDGVVEATNANKELYGDDRLLEAMKNIEYSSMEELCNNILADVNKFVGDAEQFDDITMLALKYLG